MITVDNYFTAFCYLYFSTTESRGGVFDPSEEILLELLVTGGGEGKGRGTRCSVTSESKSKSKILY